MDKQRKTPTTLLEAVRYFSDLDTCRGFLAHLRWPDGVACPRCGSSKLGWISTRKIWRCRECKREFSVKLGTIFEDSPIGLDKWLVALWAITSMKNGISSHELARTLGVTQKTAWFMNHRLRQAMKTRSFINRLSGEVEADETFIGGKMKQANISKKTAVMGLLQRGGDIRAFIVPNLKAHTLQPLVRKHVEEGSCLYTDALLSYRDLDEDFLHAFVDHAKKYVAGRVHTNGLENFWSLLKRGLKGTYITVHPQHLLRYVDEQVFRYNTRKTRDYHRFAQAAKQVSGRRLTYRDLIAKA